MNWKACVGILAIVIVGVVGQVTTVAHTTNMAGKTAAWMVGNVPELDGQILAPASCFWIYADFIPECLPASCVCLDPIDCKECPEPT